MSLHYVRKKSGRAVDLTFFRSLAIANWFTATTVDSDYPRLVYNVAPVNDDFILTPVPF